MAATYGLIPTWSCGEACAFGSEGLKFEQRTSIVFFSKNIVLNLLFFLSAEVPQYGILL